MTAGEELDDSLPAVDVAEGRDAARDAGPCDRSVIPSLWASNFSRMVESAWMAVSITFLQKGSSSLPI